MKTCRRGSIAPCPASALRRAQTGTDGWLRAGARGRKIAIELGCIWVLLSAQAPASADSSYARPCRRVPSLRLRGGRDAPWDHEAGPGGAVCNDGLTCGALDAVRLRFVPRDALSNPAAHQHFEFYPPLFAHQIFGADESIHGYISPEIDITYSEDSLLPAITFTHIPRRNPDNSPAAIPAGATDVLAAIQQNAPADYFAPDQLPPSKKRFEPRGELLGDYTGLQLGRSKQEVSAMESERGGDVRFQLFHCNAGPDIGSLRVLLQRAQSLAMWMIEAASYIDLDDARWSCIMLYEKTQPWGPSSPSHSPRKPSARAPGGAKYRLVGMVTLFRCALPADLTLEELREMSPRADQVWEHRDSMVRLNVSQFLVLPAFQGQGHGKQLLRAVYKEAQRDESVLDVRVEQPTEVFSALRQAVELDMLAEKDLLQPLRSATPPWQHMQVKLKISGARLFLLADAVGCKAGISGVKEGDEGYPTVAGVPVDLDSVYSRASVLGFSKEELDDILQAIQPEDLQGTASPQEAADRLLSSVYMAIVSDVGEAEGLSEEQVDELLARVEPADLLHISSGQEIARMILPLVGQIKAANMH